MDWVNLQHSYDQNESDCQDLVKALKNPVTVITCEIQQGIPSGTGSNLICSIDLSETTSLFSTRTGEPKLSQSTELNSLLILPLLNRGIVPHLFGLLFSFFANFSFYLFISIILPPPPLVSPKQRLAI